MKSNARLPRMRALPRLKASSRVQNGSRNARSIPNACKQATISTARGVKTCAHVNRKWSNVTKSLIWLNCSGINRQPFARYAQQLRKYESSLQVLFLPHPSLPGLKGVSPLLQMPRLFSFHYCWKSHRYRPQLGWLRNEHRCCWEFFDVLRCLRCELSLHVV